jgi:hypothetical protein
MKRIGGENQDFVDAQKIALASKLNNFLALATTTQ